MVLNVVCSMEMISSDVFFYPQSKDVQITVRGGGTMSKLESENFDFLFFKKKWVKPMNVLSKQLTINLIIDYSSIDQCSCARSWKNSHTDNKKLVWFHWDTYFSTICISLLEKIYSTHFPSSVELLSTNKTLDKLSGVVYSSLHFCLLSHISRQIYLPLRRIACQCVFSGSLGAPDWCV